MRTKFICLALAIVLVCPFAPAQWVQTNGPGSYCFAVSGTNLFAGGGGVFLSTNNGTSWTAVNNGLTNTDVRALAVSGTNLFAGTFDYGVFLSTDSGANWTAVSQGLPRASWDASRYVGIRCLESKGQNLFAGTDEGVFLSTNNGSSWTAGDGGGWPRNEHDTTRYQTATALVVSGANLFAATWGSVFLSTNNGSSWTEVNAGLNHRIVNAFAVSGTNLFAGTGSWLTPGGVFLSTNNGTSWTAVDSSLTSEMVNAFAVSGTNIFAGTGREKGGKVFLSTDGGRNWENVGTPLFGYVLALAVSEENLFVSARGEVWRRPLSEMIASIEPVVNELPVRFSLHQNYPNPFNPSTTITYELPKSSEVRLSVYDMLGREVTVLVNERKNAGSYEVEFDASGLASGVYLYRLQAGDFVQTKRLMLLR